MDSPESQDFRSISSAAMVTRDIDVSSFENSNDGAFYIIPDDYEFDEDEEDNYVVEEWEAENSPNTFVGVYSRSSSWAGFDGREVADSEKDAGDEINDDKVKDEKNKYWSSNNESVDSEWCGEHFIDSDK
jgi:hypothetical protein